MQEMGAPPGLIEQARASDEDRACEVWPENWDAVMLFGALGTQWRAAAGMAGLIWLGLDYQAVPICMRALRLARGCLPELLTDLRIMERAALGVLNDRRK